MTVPWAILILAAAGYLIGAVPFGYLLGKMHGVDLFACGSGNIGATNVGRVLGWKWGLLVFAFDLAKGMLPVALTVPLLNLLTDPAQEPTLLERERARVLVAAAAFLGHLFPIYLGFRGGKGVATGAGTVLVLAPNAAVAAILCWIVLVLATRYVSLASLASVGVLAAIRLAETAPAFEPSTLPATIYILLGTLLVFVRHRHNMLRLMQGTEHRIGDGIMRQTMLRTLHVLAAGLWFGGAAFFNFVTTPSLNRTYAEVVATAPNARTAFQPLGFEPATEQSKAQLASALFGAGVGPIFPVYFGMSAACGLIVLATAWGWRRAWPRGIHHTRWLLALAALALVLTGWLISMRVAELRAARLDPEPALAQAARQAFPIFHQISLGLSILTTLLAGVLLALAAFPPNTEGRHVEDQPKGNC